MYSKEFFLLLSVIVSLYGDIHAQEVNPSFSDTMINKANVSLQQGKVDSAVFYLYQLADSYKKSNSMADYISTFVEIGDIYIQQRDYIAALRWLDSAKMEGLQKPYAGALTSALLELHLYKGFSNEQLGRFLNAKEAYETAHLNYTDEPPAFNLGRFLYQPLGNIYARLGKHEEALLFLEKFRQLSLTAHDFNATAEAYSDLSIVYRSQRKIAKAIELYGQALALPDISTKSQGLLWSNLAAAFLEVEEPKKALDAAASALNFFKKARTTSEDAMQLLAYESWTHTIIAQAYAARSRIDLSLQHVQQALEKAKIAYGGTQRREIAKIHILTGNLWMQAHEPGKALIEFQHGLNNTLPGFKHADPNFNPRPEDLFAENSLIEALQGKAEAFLILSTGSSPRQQLQKALECYQLIFTVEDLILSEYNYETSKLLLLHERHSRSKQAMDISFFLLDKTKDPYFMHQAFRIAERNKATVLLESLRELEAKNLAGMDDRLLEEEQTLKASIASCKQRIFQGDEENKDQWQRYLFENEQALAKLKVKMQELYPSYNKLRGLATTSLTIENVQQKILDEKSTLLAYFIGKEFLYVFNVTRNSAGLERVPLEQGKLLNDVMHFINSLKKNTDQPQQLDTYAARAYELYKKLVLPAWKGDSLPERLIIIPDGILGYLPFEALLYSPPSGQQRFKQLPYLLKKMAISYAFSVAVLHENEKPKVNSTTKTFLGVAPGFEKSKRFPVLIHSGAEVDAIRSMLGGDVLKASLAEKDTFKSIAGNYRVIHLSTHAAVLDSLLLYSWISFTDEDREEEEFKLFLSELYTLQLNADLAVLSACETGAGVLSEGEGIMSLARGFAYAGCQSIVTTLWKVNHAATSEIITSFYSYLSKGWSKDQALRQAKLDYLASEHTDDAGSSPYYWTPHIVIGNREPITIDRPRTWLWACLVGGAVLLLFLGFAGHKYYTKHTSA